MRTQQSTTGSCSQCKVYFLGNTFWWIYPFSYKCCEVFSVTELLWAILSIAAYVHISKIKRKCIRCVSYIYIYIFILYIYTPGYIEYWPPGVAKHSESPIQGSSTLPLGHMIQLTFGVGWVRGVKKAAQSSWQAPWRESQCKLLGIWTIAYYTN